MAPRRFGLLGDIHAEDVLLQRALQHLHELGVDCILAVGDVVDGQGDVNRCVEMLSNEANLLVVLGNHERWLLRGVGRTLPYATQSEEVSSTTWSFIKALPATIRIQIDEGVILLCHGIGDNDMQLIKDWHTVYDLQGEPSWDSIETDVEIKIMVAGHSHHRLVRQIGPIVYINAGTLCRDHSPCFGILDLDAKSVSYYSFDETIETLSIETFSVVR